MTKESGERKSDKDLQKSIEEILVKLRELDEKVSYLIHNLRRFNHGHFDPNDESP